MIAEEIVPALRHLALWIPSDRFDSTVRFYRDAIGMRIDWRPDADNVYLSGGGDNLALHRAQPPRKVSQESSPLDHLGFCLPSAAAVASWYQRLSAVASVFEIAMLAPVKSHRDGSTSFYLRDPAGNTVQLIHIPSIATTP